jgi:hypothetical protein
MNRLIILFIISFAFVSCKKKCPTPDSKLDSFLSLTVQPKFGSNNLFLDSIYTTPEGYRVKFTDLKFYITQLKNGSSTLTDATIFDFRENGLLAFRKIGDPTQFTALQGFIGVDGTLNHLDPSAFPNESPLNISNAGTMHWGWNTGYIFLSIEGKVDTIPDGNNSFDHSFSFHIGTDSYLSDFSFSNLSWQNPSANEFILPFKLDLLSFLQNPTQPIDLKTDFLTHSGAGQEALSEIVVQNFKQAFQPY